MDDTVKSQLLTAWNRFGESFLAELVSAFQLRTAAVQPVAQKEEEDLTKKMETGDKKEVKGEPTEKKEIKKEARRKRIVKGRKRKQTSSEEESAKEDSSDEDTYQPPPLSKKTATPSPSPSPARSQTNAVPSETTPIAPGESEQSANPISEEEKEVIDMGDAGLSSSSSSSSSPDHSDGPESMVEQDPYEALTFSAETILRLVSDLNEAKDDSSKVKRILDVLDRLLVNNKGEYLQVLRETNALRDIRKAASNFPPEAKLLCEGFISRVRERLNTKSQPQDDTEEWRKLEKQLSEKVKRKVDPEILATLRRIDETIPDHMSESQRNAMRPCFKLVQQVNIESKHTEVQRKAGALYKRWRELGDHSQSSKRPEDKIESQRSDLSGKIPDMYKQAKIETITESYSGLHLLSTDSNTATYESVHTTSGQRVIITKIENRDEQWVAGNYRRLKEERIEGLAEVEEVIINEKTVLAIMKGYQMDARAFLKTHRPSTLLLRSWARQLLLSLSSLHLSGLTHGSIRPSHIFLDHNNPFLGGFTFQSDPDKTDTTEKEDSYRPPDEVVGPARDIYSLAIVLQHLATGVVPRKGQFVYHSPLFRSFIEKMTAIDPDRELSASDLLTHKFLCDSESGPLASSLALISNMDYREMVSEEYVQRLCSDRNFVREFGGGRKAFELMWDEVEQGKEDKEQEERKEAEEEWEENFGHSSRELRKVGIDSLKSGTLYQSKQLYKDAAYCYFRSLVAFQTGFNRCSCSPDIQKELESYYEVAYQNLKELRSRMDK